jgi:hypothetical protein
MPLFRAGPLRPLRPIVESRPWAVLSIGCSLFALYEGIVKIAGGHPIEGLLDLVLTTVFVVNFLNRFKALGGYIEKVVK